MVDEEPLQVPPGFTAVKIFDDPTPNGQVNQRVVYPLMVLAGTFVNFTKGESDLFIRILILVARKLASTWTHLDRFRTEQARLTNDLARSGAEGVATQHIELSQTLFVEFDEFLVQLKSTLDHLVKMGVPIFGTSVWNLRTFGNKGEDVAKVLRSNIPRGYKKQARWIGKLLFENERHKSWLKATIGARDKINHFLDGGIPIERFAVLLDKDGAVRVPMWSEEQQLDVFMENVWYSLLSFTEDFIAVFLHVRFPENTVLLHKVVPKDSTQTPWIAVPKEVMEATIKQPGWTPMFPD